MHPHIPINNGHIVTKSRAFNEEHELRDHVVRVIEKLGLGPLHPHEGLPVAEFVCRDPDRSGCVGIIDVLAFDKRGRAIVIECKLAYARPSVLGQILGYVAWMEEVLPSMMKPVRAVIVATKVSPLLLKAARLVPNIPVMVFECPNRVQLRRLV